MQPKTQEMHDRLYAMLREEQIYRYAASVLNFDQETICPPAAREKQGEIGAALGSKAFIVTKDPAFTETVEYLYEHRDELDSFDAAMVAARHKQYLADKNISPEKEHAYALAFNKAFVSWLTAKEKADYSLFAPGLAAVRDIQIERTALREDKCDNVFDTLIGDYERGLTQAVLDPIFDRMKERLIPLLARILASKKQIRTDFMTRTVTDEQQRQIADYLLDVIGFDKTRGAITLTEHPFTHDMSRNDVRVTTHFYPQMFDSSMFSVVHEGGHALFEQFCPEENDAHFLHEKTMGMHESVSRFYENRIGRSKEFIHLIFPKCREIFPQVLSDVTEEELYEALNVVRPSLKRTQADEFTYTFHIIIRYEIEKMILNGTAEIADLPRIWNDKYEEYLGIRPGNDAEGILQDIHWTFGFGYFPTYAIGNLYNAMYLNTMKQHLDVPALVREGKLPVIRDWMAEHVFRMADRQTPEEWIKAITGRALTPDDYLDYLEEKYTALYEL